MSEQVSNTHPHLYFVCGRDLGFQKQTLCLLPWPVVWHLHATPLLLAFFHSFFSLLLLLPQVFNNLTKSTVFAQEFECRFGTNASDRLQIIATKEDAQLNKL